MLITSLNCLKTSQLTNFFFFRGRKTYDYKLLAIFLAAKKFSSGDDDVSKVTQEYSTATPDSTNSDCCDDFFVFILIY